MKSLRHGTPPYHFGVDFHGLDARLVRVGDGRLADGVVAAARAEHRISLFVSLLFARRAASACCGCLRGGTAHFVSQRSREAMRRSAVVRAGIDAVLCASTDELCSLAQWFTQIPKSAGGECG